MILKTFSKRVSAAVWKMDCRRTGVETQQPARKLGCDPGYRCLLVAWMREVAVAKVVWIETMCWRWGLQDL